MKTTLTILAVLFLVALFYYRQRIYVRDPLATVYRSDVPQAGVEVFINYSNDVLLWQEAEPNPYRILLQDWNRMPGTPMTLTCIHWVACLTDSDRTSTIPLTSAGYPRPNSPTRHGANPPPRSRPPRHRNPLRSQRLHVQPPVPLHRPRRRTHAHPAPLI